MRIPEDLRSRFESLSKDGRREVLEFVRHPHSPHEVEMKIHSEEDKDWHAKDDAGEIRGTTPSPFHK